MAITNAGILKCLVEGQKPENLGLKVGELGYFRVGDRGTYSDSTFFVKESEGNWKLINYSEDMVSRYVLMKVINGILFKAKWKYSVHSHRDIPSDEFSVKSWDKLILDDDEVFVEV